jgi:hypothetical protein
MNPVTRAIRKLLLQPAYIVAALLLAISAIGLNSAVGYLQLHFKKLPCPLRVVSLKEGIPTQMGEWMQVSQDQPIDSEDEQILGTTQYVFRDYVDSSAIGKDEIEAMKNASRPEYESMRLRLQERHPEAFMTAAVTYYTGLVDTVAHIPERCYVADGYEVSKYDEIDANLHGANGWQRNLKYRFLSFEDQTGTRRVSRNVGYVFHVNGQYDCNSFGVRGRLQDLRERYGYYAKVELMTQTPGNRVQDTTLRDQSARAMEKFMAAALPQIEKCLPDWQALHGSPLVVAK